MTAGRYRRPERRGRRLLGCLGGTLLLGGLLVAGLLWWRGGDAWLPAGLRELLPGRATAGTDGGPGGDAAPADAAAPGDARAAAPGDGRAAPRDGGIEAADGQEAGRPAPTVRDAARSAVGSDAGRDAGAPASDLVCPADVDAPRLLVADLVGDERPELLVLCGARVLVHGRAGGCERLLRVLEAEVRPELPGVHVEAAEAAVGDVTGDGLVDLVVGFAYRADAGGWVGGALHLLPRAPGGGFGEPVRLASAPVLSVHLAQLDGRGGLDVAAVVRGDRLAGRPARLRLWSGGVAPRPLSRQPLPLPPTSVGWLDVDGDGRLDLLAAAPGRLLVRRGPLPEDRPAGVVEVDGLLEVAAVPGAWLARTAEGLRRGRWVPASGPPADGGDAGGSSGPALGERVGPGGAVRRLAATPLRFWVLDEAGAPRLARTSRLDGGAWPTVTVPAGIVADVAEQAGGERLWLLWRPGLGAPWRLRWTPRPPQASPSTRPVDAEPAPLLLRIPLP